MAPWIPYVAVLIGMYVLHSAWIAILLYHAGIAAFLFLRKPAGLWIRMRTGFKTPLLMPGLLIGALAAPVVYFLWPWFSVSDNILPQWMAYYGLSGWAWLLLIPYFSMIHPILEEALWREIAPKRFTWFCRQDLLFAGYHVLVLLQLMKTPWLVLVFPILAGSSIWWRWSVARCGGYGVSLLTHATADAGVVIAVLLLLRHYS